MYHCHVHTVKHLEMGMYGAFVVTSNTDPKLINNSSTKTFDDEWIMMISTVDPAYHTAAAKDDSTIFADYNPRYFLINGEEGNAATINPLLSKTITLTPGQTKDIMITLDKAVTYNPQIMFGDLRNNNPFAIVYSGAADRTSVVKTELIVK